jgi:mRNA interferase MazF
MNPELHRGDVVRVRLDPSVGGEIRKTRPSIVMCNDAACRFDAVIQIVPVTSLPDRPLRPYEARIDSDSSGLGKPSRAVANQLRTVSKTRLVGHLGRLTRRELEAVERSVEIQLGLSPRRS